MLLYKILSNKGSEGQRGRPHASTHFRSKPSRCAWNGLPTPIHRLSTSAPLTKLGPLFKREKLSDLEWKSVGRVLAYYAQNSEVQGHFQLYMDFKVNLGTKDPVSKTITKQKPEAL